MRRWGLSAALLFGACVEVPSLATQPTLPGAASALVVADHGAGAPERFEAYAARVDPATGAVLDLSLVTSATTVSFVGYPCPLEHYGWAPGPLPTIEGDSSLLPPNASLALSLLGRELAPIAPPRRLAGITGRVAVEDVEAASVRAFHGGAGANIAGGRPRALAVGDVEAALFLSDWGIVVFGTESSFGEQDQDYVLFDAFGLTGFDGLVGLTGGAPSALVFLADRPLLHYALSDRPALRGLTGGWEADGAAYYAIDILKRELVRLTESPSVAVTRTFAAGLPSYAPSMDLVWSGPGRIYLVDPGSAPLEITEGRLRRRLDLPGALLSSGGGFNFAADRARALTWPVAGGGAVEWDCPLPSLPVAVAVDAQDSAVAGEEELYLRGHGACGRCRRLQPTPPVARVRDLALFPHHLFVIQNAFDSQFAITTWIDRPDGP